jgi:hypothetical protein
MAHRQCHSNINKSPLLAVHANKRQAKARNFGLDVGALTSTNLTQVTNYNNHFNGEPFFKFFPQRTTLEDAYNQSAVESSVIINP